MTRPGRARSRCRRHAESFIPLADVGRRFPPYRPTFRFAGRFVDAAHAALGACRVDSDGCLLKRIRPSGPAIPGWLRPADALKLYELAYFVDGDVLEIGAHHGLSTSILAQACNNSPRKKMVRSVEINPQNVVAARRTLSRLELGHAVEFIWDSAQQALPRLSRKRRRFGLVFVDHAHDYESVRDVCRRLGALTNENGFCFFHDFNDGRNRNARYSVYQAVRDSLPRRLFQFYGIFGCAALYRKRGDVRAAPAAR